MENIIHRSYVLDGLDCANCAEKIRAASEKISYVKQSEMNFMKKELTLHLSDDVDFDAADKEITELVHSLEPDVNVVEKMTAEKAKRAAKMKNDEHSHEHTHEHSHEHSHDSGKSDIIKLIVSAVLWIGGICIHLILDPEPELSAAFIAQIVLFGAAYLVCGLEVIVNAFRNIRHGEIFDENFLMLIASLGAFAIGEYMEAVLVIWLYGLGELFQSFAVNKSRKSISDLMDIRPDYANIKRNGKVERVDPLEVQINDIIVVKPGEKIPLDGEIINGTASLDTAALTGESLPADVNVGDSVMSGAININGVIEIKVSKLFGDSTAAKILELTENAGAKKAQTENFITSFAKVYTPIVVIAALIIAILPPLITGNPFSDWIYRALVFLVISCPCALVISVPLSYFAGIGRASKSGILVKGGNCLDAMSKLKTVIFDKTGTLTKGIFKVNKIAAVGVTSEKLLEYAAMAESVSSHPIAVSIKNAYGKEIDEQKISDCLEVAGEGIIVTYEGKKIAAGNAKLMKRVGATGDTVNDTCVYIALDGIYAGYIIVGDEVKESSAAAISKLKKSGVERIVMLTGDKKAKAAATAAQLGIDEFKAELLPQDKLNEAEKIKSETNGKLAFVGDGINDAPVLALSDIGISMGAIGSDSAVEASDIVLMNDDPMQIFTAREIAQKTKRIVVQNIVLALAVKLLIQILGFLGIATMLSAVFADVGVCIIAIINAMRILRMKK